MKLVGGDSGRYEHEEFVDEVVLAPSERVVVDVLFDRAGRARRSSTAPPSASTRWPRSPSSDEPAEPALADAVRRRCAPTPTWPPSASGSRRYLDAEPDKTLAFVAEMDMDAPEAAPVVYACPMHPEVVSDEPGTLPEVRDEAARRSRRRRRLRLPDAPRGRRATQPGRCPKCGMKLRAVAQLGPSTARARARTTSTATTARSTRHDHAASDGIEWEDDMVEVNRITTPANMRWKLVDRETGAENARDRLAVPRRRPGEDPAASTRWTPTIRCTTRSTSTAPAASSSSPATASPSRTSSGRTPCWCGPARPSTSCSTSPTPAVWMAHCHIAEHHESGMMFSFDVTE